MTATALGEFEHQLLLVILRLGADAGGLEIARELETRANRRVSRGALYTTLDRLEDKGLVRWAVAPGGSARQGLPRRIYTVTSHGVAALRTSRETLRRLWRGLEGILKEPTS